MLSDLFIMRGVPEHIRSGDGPESVATAVQRWIEAVGAKAATIVPGSPWENGSVESFDARLRDELLDSEIVHSLREAEIVIESWGRHDNALRPHASLGYRSPDPESAGPAHAAWRQGRRYTHNHTRQPDGRSIIKLAGRPGMAVCLGGNAASLPHTLASATFPRFLPSGPKST